MNKENKGYRNLIAWQFANRLAHLIYDLTEGFPKSELFGLTSQMRRAVVSIGANIAEGYTRSSKKEKARFFNIALGSLTEVEYYIDFALERNYYSSKEHVQLSDSQTETAKVLSGLIKSLK